jgi:hypothetical protein
MSDDEEVLTQAEIEAQRRLVELEEVRALFDVPLPPMPAIY